MNTELINVMETQEIAADGAIAPDLSIRRRQCPRVAFIASGLPPRLDGIGDHTHRLAAAMANRIEVNVFTVRGFNPDPIPGVNTHQCFAIHPRRGIADLAPAITEYSPDWIILQYNPFCFGKRGLNPYLAPLLTRVKKSSPRSKLAVMVHEMYMPFNSLRNAVMSAYQRWQLRAITSLADLTLFSTGPWLDGYRKHHPTRACGLMPVGSNLDRIDVDRAEVRRRLGITPETVLLGAFGGSHPSRLIGHIAASAKRLRECGYSTKILSIGSAGVEMKSICEGVEVIDLGLLDAAKVSENMQAIDIYCSPFIDGVSCRRGSFFAGLQHGLPTVTTTAYHTERELSWHDGTALFAPRADDSLGFVHAVKRLADDNELRARFGRAAQTLFQEKYDLPVLMQRWMRELGMEALIERR